MLLLDTITKRGGGCGDRGFHNCLVGEGGWEGECPTRVKEWEEFDRLIRLVVNWGIHARSSPFGRFCHVMGAAVYQF